MAEPELKQRGDWKLTTTSIDFTKLFTKQCGDREKVTQSKGNLEIDKGKKTNDLDKYGK